MFVKVVASSLELQFCFVFSSCAQMYNGLTLLQELLGVSVKPSTRALVSECADTVKQEEAGQ